MTSWIGLIGVLIVEQLFGSALLAAAVFFGLMIAVGVVSKFTYDAWIVNITALGYVLFFHPSTAILPSWLWQAIAVVLGIFVGLATIRIFNRR